MQGCMAVGPAEKGHSPFPSSERAIYGFALYLGSSTFLVLFLLWAFLPNEWLYFIGFSYFPQKYWAVAVPAFLCVAVGVFLCLSLGANLLLVPRLEEPRTITDPQALSSPSTPHKTSVPPLHDIPISVVNSTMFGRRDAQQR